MATTKKPATAQGPDHLALTPGLLRPGMRVAVAVSGGADSVALLRTLLGARGALGLVLSVAHVHHGIRGADADADEDFVAALAGSFDLPLHRTRVDTPAAARERRETLEEAARHLRYEWFGGLLRAGEVDAVATAHTLDDQAETVLLKLLRGAWTEGLGGIHPVVTSGPGVIVRPLLSVRRAEIEAYLRSLGQAWREDASNQDPAHTRNRLRHHLLPVLAAYNPQIHTQLAHMATIARDEEAWWQAELARLLPQLLLPGKPVRGGGRSTSTLPGEESVAIEIERLRPLAPAVRRRVLRAAAATLAQNIDFDATERLLALGGLSSGTDTAAGKAGSRQVDLAAGLVAERNARELRLVRRAVSHQPAAVPGEVRLPVPGEAAAPEFRLYLRAAVTGAHGEAYPEATLRAWRAGDRVLLRYSRGPRKVKEVLQRILASRVPVAEMQPDDFERQRAAWPVVEWRGEIVWMLGADVDSPAAAAVGLTVRAEALTSEARADSTP